MSFLDQLKWSFRHLRKQLLESLLVVAAIALGVGVIITVLAMLLSVGNQYRQNETAEHFRTLEIMSKAEASRRTGAPLTLIGADIKEASWSAKIEDVTELQRHLPATMHAFVEMHWAAKTPLLAEEEVSEAGPMVMWRAPNQIYIAGTTPEYFAFKAFTLQSGNFFLTSDLQNKNRVLILTHGLAKELFGEEDPLGQVVPLSVFGDEEEHIFYTVIGILDPPQEEGGFYFGYRDERMAYAPITASPYSRFESEAETRFSTISVGVDAGIDLASATEQVENEARLVWGDKIAVRSSFIDFRESQKQMQRYALLIGVFASVGLVIAVINILNLMLARVLKRTKSIGLSMALGSSRKLVFRQFMLEALSLGVLGSAVGILISFVLATILQRAIGSGIIASLAKERIVLGIGIGFLISLFFGVYPAYLGSKIHPVDALRTD